MDQPVVVDDPTGTCRKCGMLADDVYELRRRDGSRAELLVEGALCGYCAEHVERVLDEWVLYAQR